MDERLQFVARRLAGEAMAELCTPAGVLVLYGCGWASASNESSQVIRSKMAVMSACI